MPAIFAITVIIQGFFIFHVFRTGRPYWWAFIILSMPVLGCLIYYLIEVFPNSREHRSARQVARNLARSLQPDAEMKRRIEEAEIFSQILAHAKRFNVNMESERAWVKLARQNLSGQ